MERNHRRAQAFLDLEGRLVRAVGGANLDASDSRPRRNELRTRSLLSLISPMGVPEASVERSEPRRCGVSVSAAAVATDAVSANDVDVVSGAAAGAAAHVSTATAGTDSAVTGV